MAMDEQPAKRRAEMDLRASDTDRDHVAERLRAAAGHGRISLDELEERLEAVYAAKTYGELVPITADLPRDAEADGVGAPVGRALRVSEPQDATPLVGGAPGSVRRSAIAIMAGAKRAGAWVLPKRFRAFAFWGGVVIDLREARYEHAESVITATAIMGGVQIIAPENVYVDVTGIGIMGGFGENRSNGVGRANAPVVRVQGFAFWGGVMVQHVEAEQGGRGGRALEG
ncbi:DUF1707 SHOCT-like domain-containing protein [Actinospica robiniae]|uniref:DUF1707 SHOCT-like domain-containing protein n=1 Tax=Actinospica robiniae TaxID=304901 RepID=UPI0003F66DA4|nr:DUF1707 domain-containing protein [Actinospica robiniae]